MPREIVVVMRSFAEPTRVEEIAARAQRNAWCLETHEVKYLRSYGSRDGLHMVCLFEAPDAEAVRQVNDIAGMPYDAIWTAIEHIK